MEKIKNMSLTTKTLVALVLGVLAGILLFSMPSGYVKDAVLITGIFNVIGNGFIRLMKMVVVPLVFASLVTGTLAIGDVKKIGTIGTKTIGFYMFTTACAILIALTIGYFMQPGAGFDMSAIPTEEVVIADDIPVTETILNFIPDNPIASMAEGDMIPIIVFALFIGVALSILGEKATTVSNFFAEFNEVMMTITMLVMKIAPIGVFCLVSKTFATLGADALVGLLKYFFAVLFSLGIQCFVVYSILLFLFTGLSPKKFFSKFISVMTFAFSTSSSNATIPASIEALDEKLGVSRNVSSFTVPLGATINMDGTAMMQGVAVMFTAQAYGIALTPADYVTVISTATLASIGTAGVPGVGLVMLTLVLQSVGLPIEAIGVIMGIDRLLDMTRTSVNVAGDAICTTILSFKEKEIDLDKFNS